MTALKASKVLANKQDKHDSSVEHSDEGFTIEKFDLLNEIAQGIAAEFALSDDDLQILMTEFVAQLDDGLGTNDSAIEQLPSFITQVPNGTETGTYLAVDMGGTNIRVCAVTLKGDATYSLEQDKILIPSALMTANSPVVLFEWVAQAVKTFVERLYPDSEESDKDNNKLDPQRSFDLGFTFSHATQQDSVASGRLIRWSKGFNIDGAVGQDVCALLQQALTKLTLPIRVVALINDTVGTLLAQAYSSPHHMFTVAGAVFGTGTNCAYVETLSRITKLHLKTAQHHINMVLNTEWGNFDQYLKVLPDTIYDRAIDAGSVNPGFEMFEKRVSGMYLGELLRLAIVSVLDTPDVCLFPGARIPQTSSIFCQGSLDTSLMSHLERDVSADLVLSREKLEHWSGIRPINTEAVHAIRAMSHAIGKRSAQLSAVALGAVIVQSQCLNKQGEDGKDWIGIGVDGTLIELYPGFITEIRRSLRCLVDIGEAGESRIVISIAKDGSGVGAALAAHLIASAREEMYIAH
ncbi:hypothetical protein DE146DRAFT_625178 [Phaeosphaeria sp. MPI-PUGE-AT-0046c]|nr:hypothetical protein DE146DRAFT_625178 [Phaeosphaeria sp. MPI-PUGE-AT-0046c]